MQEIYQEMGRIAKLSLNNKQDKKSTIEKLREKLIDNLDLTNS